MLAYLGAGNQGQVYRAALGTSEVALKWYLPRRRGGAAGHGGGPGQERAPDRRFLWPLELAEAPDVSGFGYVMPLRAERYKASSTS